MNNPNNNLINIMMNAMANNQDVQNKLNEDETLRTYYQTIQNNDQKKGEELAMQILQSCGLSKEQALQQAYAGLSQMGAMAMMRR